MTEKERYEDYDDLDELDDLDDLDGYSLIYQVKIVGYDDNDDETGYELKVDDFDTESDAINCAESITKDDLTGLTENEYYVRVEIQGIIKGIDFSEHQDPEYSHVIVIK